MGYSGRPFVRHAHRTKAVLPWWSLLVAFGAAIVVYATVGITTYRALMSAVGTLRQLVRSAGRRAETAETEDA